MDYYMEPPHYRPRGSSSLGHQNPSESVPSESSISKLVHHRNLLLGVSALVNLGVTGFYWIQNHSKLQFSDVGPIFLLGFYANLAWNTYKINLRRLRRAQKFVAFFIGALFKGTIGYLILATTVILKAILEGEPSEIVGHIQVIFGLALSYIVLMLTHDLLDGFLHGFIGESEIEKRARKHFFRANSH